MDVHFTFGLYQYAENAVKVLSNQELNVWFHQTLQILSKKSDGENPVPKLWTCSKKLE
jgi:hypothetical protein